MVDEKKLIEAAKLISDYCDYPNCYECIFSYYGNCMFTHEFDRYANECRPFNWDIWDISYNSQE